MKKWKGILTNNISLKILSFLLASLLWVSIMNVNDPYITETIQDINVETVNKWAIGDSLYQIESGRTVSVTVRGKRSVIDTLSASDFTAEADFTKLSIVNAVPIDVSLRSGTEHYSQVDVKIQTSQPMMMTLDMQERIEKLFTITVETTGEVMDGFYYNGAQLAPAMLNVKATSEQMQQIDRVVAYVDITNADRSFNSSVVPVALDADGNRIDAEILFDTEEFTASVELLHTKDISVFLSQAGEVPDGYICTELITPPDAVFRIAGTREELDGIPYLAADVDVTGFIETDDYTVDVEEELKAHYPDSNVIVLGNKVLNVRVAIEQLAVRDMEISTSSIEGRNLADGLRLIFYLDRALIKIRGQEQVVENVKEESLALYIDLADLGAGVHLLSVKTDTRADIELTLPTVQVAITDPAEDDSMDTIP